MNISRICVICGPLTNGKLKLSTPSASLVAPVSGGQSVTTANAITYFPPLRGGSKGGEGVDKIVSDLTFELHPKSLIAPPKKKLATVGHRLRVLHFK